MELLSALVAGLLGSSHCIGMCGGFALSLGVGAGGWRAAAARQSVYSLGRLFCYAFLGAVAATLGARLVGATPTWVNASAWLSVAAGGLLLYLGAEAAGLIPRKGKRASTPPCLASGLYGALLRGPTSLHAFAAGVFTGFLPCGLLYAMLSLAAASASPLQGAAIMAVFAAGTAPAMIAIGLGGQLFTTGARRWLFAAAAWSVLLAGAAATARGVAVLSAPPEATPADVCPFCE